MERCLDSIASMFAVYSPCAAISKAEDKWLLSNKYKENFINDRTIWIQRNINKLGGDDNEVVVKTLIVAYLVLNVDFAKNLKKNFSTEKKTSGSNNETNLKDIDILHDAITGTYKTIILGYITGKRENNFEYNELINAVYEAYDNVLNHELLYKVPQNIILRPSQDVTKILV